MPPTPARLVPRLRRTHARALFASTIALSLLACAGGTPAPAAEEEVPAWPAEPLALVDLPDEERPTGLALLPGGAFAATVKTLERPEGGFTTEYGGVRFRAVDGGPGPRADLAREPGTASAVAVSPDGTRIAVARYDRVDLVPLDGGEARSLSLDAPAGAPLDDCASPWQLVWGGSTIAARCGTGVPVLLLDTETGARTIPLARPGVTEGYVTVTDLALSADARTLVVVGSTDDFSAEPRPWLELRSLPDGALVRTIALDQRYEDAAISPDGTRLAVSHPYFGLQIRDAATGAVLAEHVYDADPGNRGSGDVAWAPDGSRLYRVGRRLGVAVHDGADARVLGYLPAHPTEPENPMPPPPGWPAALSARNGSLALSSDGRVLASIERSDFGRAVRIWRLAP